MTFIAPDSIQLTLPGTYRVDYLLIPTQVYTTLALFLNGTEIPGSRYTTNVPPSPVDGTVIFTLEAGDVPAVLTLRNVDPMNSATLVVGQLPNTVNASLLITAIDVQP